MWLGLSAALGCADLDPAEEELCGAPSLAVGTGEDRFVPLSEGDPIAIVHGMQGGWHVEVAGLISGVRPEIEVHATLTAPGLGDIALSGEQPPTALLLEGYDEESCTGAFSGIHALIDAPPGTSEGDLACGLSGQVLSLSLSAVDLGSGREAHSERSLVGQPDPAGDSCP